MRLDTKTSEALDRWLKRSTWYKDHKLDEDRYFDFVDAYAQESGTYVEEDAMRDEIYRRLEKHGHPAERDDENPGSLASTIVRRISLMVNILSFLKRRQERAS